MKKFGFLLIGVLIHFGLTFAIIVSRLDCGLQPKCVTLFNEVAGSLLTFPLGLVVWGMDRAGLNSEILTASLLGGDIFFLSFLNSILAVCFGWYVLIKPIIKRKSVR